MPAKNYEAILAGGGAAGLSLAYRLKEAWPDITLLIVDEEVKRHNDHTWCFWSTEPTYLDAVAYRRWSRVDVIGQGVHLKLALDPYDYRMVRGVDFYRWMREALADRSGVEFQHGTVTRVVDGEDRAEIWVNELVYAADWVFDSRYRPSSYRPRSPRYHYLTQHFLGWEIESERPIFNPEAVRLFDFRTPQHGAMRFVYVLPYGETRGLVEYTLFSKELLPGHAYERALRSYIEEVLGTDDYRIVEEERDIIPMTDEPVRRRAGRRVLNIGTRGGRVKASSGYAFRRIQQDARAVVTSLRDHGHPFALPSSPPRYRLFDAMLLQVLEQHGERGAEVFLRLFQRNPVDRIFRFLDEEDGLIENLRLMATVPQGLFTRAWFGLQARRHLPSADGSQKNNRRF